MGLISEWIQKGLEFLREVRAELERVTWPTREAIIGGTLAVIFVSGVLTLYIWIADLLVSRVIALLMR